MADLGALTVQFRADTSDFNSKIGESSGKIDAFAQKGSNGLSSFSSALKGATSEVPGLSNALSLISNPFTAVIAGAVGLGAVLGSSISSAGEFQQSIAELSAITGIGGKDLDYLAEQSKKVGAESGLGAKQASEAFKLLASNIDVSSIGGVKALSKMQEQVVLLAQASGVDLPTASNVMVNAINQYSLSANDASKVTNILSAGAKYGASEVADLGASLKLVGATASNAGVSLETTTGALEILSQVGIKNSEAGTGLRNVILKLQTTLGKDLKKEGLVPALESLKGKLSDTTFLAKTFGTENINVATTLIKSAGAISEMTAKVTGTNVALEQATIQNNTYEGSIKRLGATFDVIKISIGEAFLPVLTAIINGVNSFITSLKDKWQVLVGFFNAGGEGGNIFGNLKDTIIEVFEAIKAIFSVFIGVYITIWNTLKEPLFAVFHTIKDVFGEVLNDMLGVLKDVFSIIKNVFTGNFEALMPIVTTLLKRLSNLIVDGLLLPFSLAVNGISKIMNTLPIADSFKKQFEQSAKNFEIFKNTLKFDIPIKVKATFEKDGSGISSSSTSTDIKDDKKDAVKDKLDKEQEAINKIYNDLFTKLKVLKNEQNTIVSAGGTGINLVAKEQETVLSTIGNLIEKGLTTESTYVKNLQKLYDELNKSRVYQVDKIDSKSTDDKKDGVHSFSVGKATTKTAGNDVLPPISQEALKSLDDAVKKTEKLTLAQLKLRDSNQSLNAGFSQITNQGIAQLTSGFVDLAVNMANSQGDFESFAQGVGNLMANALESIGKGLLQLAVSLELAKIATESGNPAAALAGGLLAIGASIAFKSVLKQTASDNFHGSHENGLNYVPFDNYRANLHQGETVVPKNFDGKKFMQDRFDGGGSTANGGGQVEFNISGDSLKGVLRKLDKRNSIVV